MGDSCLVNTWMEIQLLVLWFMTLHSNAEISPYSGILTVLSTDSRSLVSNGGYVDHISSQNCSVLTTRFVDERVIGHCP